MSDPLVDQLADDVRAYALDLARRSGQVAVNETKAAASRRSGTLADGISTTEPTLEGTRITQQITSAAPYSDFQDRGTGIYGPSGARIFPKTAKVLRFDSPAAGGVVFARSVAGSPGRHFFDEPMGQRWDDAVDQSAEGDDL